MSWIETEVAAQVNMINRQLVSRAVRGTAIMRNAAFEVLEQNGTGRLRKLRFNYPNRGKSGSVRVCYVDFEQFGLCYLLVVFAKNEQENLSAAECNALKTLIDTLEKALEERFHEHSI